MGWAPVCPGDVDVTDPMDPNGTFGNMQQLHALNCSSDMGLSENSVPLHPMVNNHYPY